MKQILLSATLLTFIISSCNKEKKCYQCSIGYNLAKTNGNVIYTIDSTVCNMTQKQMKDFEKNNTYSHATYAGIETFITECN